MRAVWLGVPEDFLEERRRLGIDVRDELWEGVVHLVPPPASVHLVVEHRLRDALLAHARKNHADVFVEVGIFARR